MIAVLFGLIFALLYGAEKIPPAHPMVRNAVQGLAALLLTSGIVSLVVNRFIWPELAEFWLSAIGVNQAIQRSGLVDVGLDFNSYDFRSLIREADTIDICFIHGEKWIGHHLNDFKDFLAHKNHSMRVCLLHEASESICALSNDFGYKEGKGGTLEDRIARASEALQSCISDLQRAGQSIGSLQIWKHSRVPKHTYYRFGDTVLLVPYNIAAGHTKIPVLAFSSKRGGVADFLSNDFALMITEHSQKIYDSNQMASPTPATE